MKRNEFFKACGAGICGCGVLGLPALAGPEEKQEQKLKPIDFSKISCCGFPCVQASELYKATLENDEKAKKPIYEKWEWKAKFGVDYDPDKIFCHTCEPGAALIENRSK